jgi:hypothetical protein
MHKPWNHLSEDMDLCSTCGDLINEDCSCNYQVSQELCIIDNCVDPQQTAREHEYTETSVPKILEDFHEHYGFISPKDRFPVKIKHVSPSERGTQAQKIRKIAYERKKAREGSPPKNLKN